MNGSLSLAQSSQANSRLRLLELCQIGSTGYFYRLCPNLNRFSNWQFPEGAGQVRRGLRSRLENSPRKYRPKYSQRPDTNRFLARQSSRPNNQRWLQIEPAAPA